MKVWKTYNMAYCIACEKEVVTHIDMWQHEYHGDDVSACYGPFASCPPPEMTEDYWKVLFAQAELEKIENAYV